MQDQIQQNVVNFCLRCHEPVPTGARFCPSCGFQLSSERKLKPALASNRHTPSYAPEGIVVAREALAGERKQVTVLFADVFASMTLFTKRSAEEAAAILDEILDRMVEAVHHYEGTVHKTMGDGMMALFGAPLSYEYHAVRACYAALRMQARLAAYSNELQRNYGVSFQIRVGLNSGEVVIRGIGSDLQMAFSAVGQTVHLASRMEQLAKPGTILTTRETVNLLGARIAVRRLGPMRVKGVPEPIEVCEVVGAAPGGFTLRNRSSLFVGREEEMARLRSALQTAQKSTGQLVFIVGEPGIGKTRLVHEFLRECEEQGCLVLHAAAAPYGRATGYRAGLDILRQYFGVGAGEDAQTVREKISAKTLDLDPALAVDLPALLWQLGALEEGGFLSLDLQTRCHQAIEANLRVIRREASRQPIVLALDNLQWIESETEQALQVMVRDVPRSTLIVITHRPEHHASWMDVPVALRIRLEALGQAPATALLDSLLGDEPTVSPLKSILIQRAGGNPFFLEECVHNLVQRGVLAGSRGAHHLTGPVASIDVPPSIRSLIEARIDRLPSEAKKVLHCAAIIGQEVPLRLLQDISDVPAEEVLDALRQLHEIGLIDQIVGFPEPNYSFHHALTYDVAYGSLLLDHRQALHTRVLGAMERAYGEHRDAYVEQLARHAVQGKIWVKAAEYLHRSGNKALSNGGSREAVAFLKEAIQAMAQLAPDPNTQSLAIEIREDLSRAMKILGDSSGAVSVLREAVELVEAMGDERRLARVLSFLSNALWDIGDPAAANQAGERAMAMAERLEDVGLEIAANFCCGGALRALGEYRRAADSLGRNIRLIAGELAYETFGLAGLASVLTRGHLAWSLAELGDFVEARRHAEEALSIANTSNHPYSITHAHLAMGGTLLRQGLFAEAMPILERGIDFCRNVPFLYPPMAADLAVAYGLSGRTNAAIRLAREAVHRGKEGGRLGRLSLIVTHLGEVFHLAGESDEAEKHAHWALELALERKELGNQVYALRLLGQVAAERKQPDLETAKRNFGEALLLAERLSMRPLAARCHLGLGRLYGRLGEPATAEGHLKVASQLFEDMGMTFWLRLALDRVAPFLTGHHCAEG